MMIKLLFFLAVTIVAVHSQFSPNQGPVIPCATDRNCIDTLKDDKSKCFNGRCHCVGSNNAYIACPITPKSPIMAPKSRPTVPVTQGRSQGSCVTDQECTNIENSKCIGGSCKCDATMTLSDDGSKCLNLARNADGGCANDTDCSAIKESICVDKKCQCKEKTHLVGDKEHSACVPDKGLGEDCAPENEECYKQHDGKNILTCNSTTKKMRMHRKLQI